MVRRPSIFSVCAALALICAALVVPTVGRAAPRHATSAIDWRAVVNHWRAQAGLPGVTEDHAFSDAALKHSIYGVKTGEFEHSEDPANPYYTPEGNEAAGASILWGWPDAQTSEKAMISRFMTTPVHGQSLIDPTVAQMGYGFYAEPENGSATTIGSDWKTEVKPPSDYYPVIWPGPGTVIPFAGGSNESPDYSGWCKFAPDAKWGPPVSFGFPSDDAEPTLGATSFRRGDVELPHCVYPTFDAIFVIPSARLDPGATYTASIVRNGQSYSTTFSVAPFPMAACAPSVPAGQEASVHLAAFRDNNHAPGYYSPADYPFPSVDFGDNHIAGATVRAGAEAGTFDLVASHTYANPGTYTFKAMVLDPFWDERTITGKITVTAPGSQPAPDTSCSAPPLAPHPGMPSPRPTVTTPAWDFDDYSPEPEESASEANPDDGPGEEEPTPTSTPTTSRDIRRTVSFRMSGHLRITGRVASDPASLICTSAQTISVQKLKRGEWTHVRTTLTSSEGTFKRRIPDRPGRYRVAVEPYEAASGSLCLYAYSSTIRHRH